MTQNDKDARKALHIRRSEGLQGLPPDIRTEFKAYLESHTPSFELGGEFLDRIKEALESLKRIRERSIRDRNLVFTSLAHHLSIGMLALSFSNLRKEAATGLDKVTVQEYQRNLYENLRNLRYRLANDEYRFAPVRRTYIPKASGGQRPLGICNTEDKIVQGAVKLILEAIYEPCFAGMSYGFRPVTRAHDALDTLAVAIESKNVNYILDADIVGCFDNIDKDILMEVLKLKVTDRRILRLVRRMLTSGVLDKGVLRYDESGVVQGAVASPILANIFLDHVLDRFFFDWRKYRIGPQGFSCMVRYADDFICGFETKEQAERYLKVLEDRLLCAGLRLHKGKTLLIPFGRKARWKYTITGEGKPKTFKFLGFEHICGIAYSTRRFKLVRVTASDRIEKKIKAMTMKLRGILLSGNVENGITVLNQFLRGYFAYFAVHGNLDRLWTMRYRLCKVFYKLLCRRSQRTLFTWVKFNELIEKRIVQPKVCHKYPSMRHNSRQRWLDWARHTVALYCIL